MFLWGEDNIWKNGDRKQADGSDLHGLCDTGTYHLKIDTVNCGEFCVPLTHVTLHKLEDSCRVLFRDDPEWRDISLEEAEYIVEEIVSNL